MNPRKVYSDQGSQLTSQVNYMIWMNKEATKNWKYNMLVEAEALAGTTWEFVPVGC